MRYLLILFLLMTTQAQAAKIKIYKDTSSSLFLYLTGTIKNNDWKRLLDLMAMYGHRSRKVLVLHSEGGSIYEAIRLGRMVRQWGIITAIGPLGRCMSACPLIYFAGWNKYTNTPYRLKHPWGEIGLHHPYHKIKGKKIPSDAFVMNEMKQYLEYMQAGEGLFQLIQKTPSNRMAAIENRTLERLGGYIVRKGPVVWPERAPSRQEAEYATETVPLPVKRPCDTGCKKTKLIYDRAPSYKGADAIELLRNVAGD